mgnify:CR=1 FL=1
MKKFFAMLMLAIGVAVGAPALAEEKAATSASAPAAVAAVAAPAPAEARYYGRGGFFPAVAGGLIAGAVIGGLLIGLAEQLVAGYLSPDYRDAITFVILIVVLILRPEGILGVVRQEKV